MLDYSSEIIKALEREKIPGTIVRQLIIKENPDVNIQCENQHFISIPQNLYEQLDELCKMNDWDTRKKIISMFKSEIISAEIIETKNGQKHVINF